MAVFLTIVLDGVGAGSQPDAADYGDEGSNTLRHVCETASPSLPALTALGLGNVLDLPGVPAVAEPTASFGRMTETSAGKDSTTGHWELAGIRLEQPFPVYPHGFPAELIERFIELTGVPGVLGNRAASGTEIIEEFGAEHVATGRPIVYTSADSVFQVAAHVDTIDLEEQYRICEIARTMVCIGEHAVGRVIARPFTDGFVRLSDKRRDYAVAPPTPNLLTTLQESGIRTISIGKVADLFAGWGFDFATKTTSNRDGVEAISRTLSQLEAGKSAFVWANLVDFDQEFGHRNDPVGFARALEEFDGAVDSLIARLGAEDALVITADHGNDPTFPGTDHTREYVPLLFYRPGRSGKDLGVRQTFADHAATVSDFFGSWISDRGAISTGRRFPDSDD